MTLTKGRRDLIAVLLAAELGIRSGDICRLRLSDIHWERSTIEFIQAKTGVFNQLPLLENIKYALIDYLRASRPTCDSDLLFIGIKNNHGMISVSQMHSIVSKYFKYSGVDISKRRHGPHALRHSLAGNLLRIGAIYDPEKALKDLPAEERLKERQASIKLLVEEFIA